MTKTILITGATGFIGSYLIRALSERGDRIIILSRNAASAKNKLENISDAVDLEDYLTLQDEQIDAIINLAGTNVSDKRWSTGFKQQIYDSRINTTKKIAELIFSMKNKPGVLISSSGVDYYGDTGDRIADENFPPGDTFLANVCKNWEREAYKAEESGVRVAVMRTGFVMARDSKAVEKLVLPFRFYLGGPLGSGKQYISWIHINDVIGIFLFVLDNQTIKGPVNVCSPNPETMKQFSRHLGRAIKKPSFFPVPSFAVKIAAGQMAEVILSGRRAVPARILKAGYKFKFENALDAWKDIFRK